MRGEYAAWVAAGSQMEDLDSIKPLVAGVILPVRWWHCDTCDGCSGWQMLPIVFPRTHADL